MNVNHLILDHVHICELRGEELDFTEFIAPGLQATAIAEETSPKDREMVLASILPDAEWAALSPYLNQLFCDLAAVAFEKLPHRKGFDQLS